MFPEFFIVAIIGWCGTGWPRRFPNVPGGGVEPGDWPPNCPMCGQIIGAASAVVIYALVGKGIEASGFLGLATLSFFAGSFGSNLVGNLRSLVAGR